MEESVKDRINRYIKYIKKSRRAFSLSIGMSENYIVNIRKSIQPEVIKKISKRYPDLNMGWLMTGSGSMIIEPLKDRLMNLVNNECVTDYLFCVQAKLKEGFLDNLTDKISKEDIDKITNTFPNWNMNYILTGQGEPYLNPVSMTIKNITPLGILRMGSNAVAQQFTQLVEKKVIAPYELVLEKEKEILILQKEINRLKLLLDRNRRN
jgi:hypothetical protein